ncbi:hypothetical protein C2845_PM05G10080 [Panicum miliaceum]|uniref:F-box domain-containing protein n=1 Tax=Panicum miliaceum TaxID=4540 RepID=A0A3L6SY01_PANMI|nr:hypothetical protein C2845_PM05G10080 [Panicum miliaceum]
MYVSAGMDTLSIVLDASLSCANVGCIPHPSTTRWSHRQRLVESDGDVLLLQFYTHGFYNSEVIDMDIHRLDTSRHVWEKLMSNRARLTLDEDAGQVAALWSNLPIEMVEELAPKISFIDYLNVRRVCKQWSLISKPIQYAKRYPRYPMLMSICSSSAGAFKLFDPIVDKEYTVKSSSLVPSEDYFQTLLFAKDGWVMVIRGQKCIYAVNPFTGDIFDFPELPWLGNNFDGISFSSAPKSIDCIVCSIYKERASNPAHSNHIYVMVWRAGDKQWTVKKIDDDHTPHFRTAYSNPVFYHGEFYCLGTCGNLGIFNLDQMTWRVLAKPEPILNGDPMPGEQYCHLLEFRDNLIAIIRPHDKGPIDMYRLDKFDMVWRKVERLDAQVVYVDNWNAIMMPAPRDICCNRTYMPKFGAYGEGREANHHSGAFYDLKSREYYPNYYGLTERMNSIWVVPNFREQ